jgi:hypothetical protein
MRQHAQSEGVLVEVIRLPDKVGDEVPRAHVVGQVAEEHVAEGVVADVLDEATAVSIGVGLPELGGGSRREAFQEQRRDLVMPKNIHQLLVREQRVSRTGLRHTEKHANQQQHPGATAEDRPQWLTNHLAWAHAYHLFT